MIKKIIKKLIGVNLYMKLASVKYINKNKELKGLLLENKMFKDQYKGKRCFVLGNGPSLKSIDFSLLENEYTFTTNMLPKNPDFSKLKTNFHVWSDYRFFIIDKNKPEDMEIVSTMKSVNTDGNEPIVFYDYEARKMISEFELDKYLNIHYFSSVGIDMDKIIKADIDFTRLVPGFATVIHYIICLAVYMGFEEIVLLGCDCTGIITTAKARLKQADEGMYAYSIDEKEKKRIENAQKYTSFKDEVYWYYCLLDHYKKLNDYCKKNNVRLVNATVPTLLEDVEHIDLNDCLHPQMIR